ncbi:MAG: glycosyltransferase family 2 protein [Pseudomonadota bacterium]
MDVDVSVVVAAWNVDAFLEASIESALSQAGVNVEVLISDDFSTDGTVSVADAISARDPRVVTLRAPRNGGPSAARNRAIAAAKGEWIAVLDADDRFEDNRLSSMISLARAKGADLVFDLFREVDETGEELQGSRAPRYKAPQLWTLERWARENIPSRSQHASMPPGYLKPLIRTSFLRDAGVLYRETLRNSEDYVLVAEILAAGGVAWVSDKIGYLYTRREGSISHRIEPHHVEALLAAEREILAARDHQLDDATTATLHERIASLEDTLACERIISALKKRDVVKIPQILINRPRAIGPFGRWIGEVVAKRVS